MVVSTLVELFLVGNSVAEGEFFSALLLVGADLGVDLALRAILDLLLPEVCCFSFTILRSDLFDSQLGPLIVFLLGGLLDRTFFRATLGGS